MLEPFDGANDMRPAVLSQAFVIRLVRTEHVRTEHPGERLSQDLFEYLRPSGSCDVEVGHQGSDKNPQPAADSLGFPARFIHIKHRLPGQAVLDAFTATGYGSTHFFKVIAHRAEADGYTEEGEKDFL